MYIFHQDSNTNLKIQQYISLKYSRYRKHKRKSSARLIQKVFVQSMDFNTFVINHTVIY